MDDETNTTKPSSIIGRPRILYAGLFAWLALSGGRFTAPFLEKQIGLSEFEIGLAMGVQCGVSSFVGSLGGCVADSLEKTFPNRGRMGMVCLGILISSSAFVLHGVDGGLLWHLALRVVYALGMSISMPVLDGITLAYLKFHDDTANFGKERLYGAVTWAISSIVLGPCIDRYGFRSLYVSCVLSTTAFFVCALVYMRLSLPPISYPVTTTAITPPSTTNTVSLPMLLYIICGSIYGSTFLFCFFLQAMGTSVVEFLLFLFFTDFFTNASNTLCGWTIAITVIFEIPIFQLSPFCIKHLGPAYMLLISCFAYITRVVGYTLIPHDRFYYIFCLEPLHGVTYAFTKTSSVEFVNQLMPHGYEATGQGLLTIFMGFGSLSGLVLGGYLQQVLGAHFMYRFYATLVAVGAAAFMLVHCHHHPLWTKKQQDAGSQLSLHASTTQKYQSISSQ